MIIKWKELPTDIDVINDLEEHGYSPTLSKLLSSRNITSSKLAKEYFTLKLSKC